MRCLEFRFAKSAGFGLRGKEIPGGVELGNRICFAPENVLSSGMKLSRLGMLIVAFALASGAGARDITTTTGEVFHNAVVTKVQPDGIRIVADDGAGFLNFQILTEPDRKDFGFDPATYAAAEKDEASFAKRLRDLRLLAAQQALVAAKKAAAAYAALPPPSPYPSPWPTTVEASYQTPDFYNGFGGSGWVSWPYVPSTYISSPGFGTGYRNAFGSSIGGASSMFSAARRR